MDRLTGVIKDYDWGDQRAIADILGHEPPGHPEAEYWLGAHPSAPSKVGSANDGGASDLAVRIDEDPEATIGSAFPRFKNLPFLLKILAAAGPLSIQAHPSLDQAKAGFAREDEAGIDRAAPNRNYRDDNHKPELICAVTPFEAKCGFREVGDTRQLLALLTGPMIDELGRRLDVVDDAVGLADAVRWLLELPTGEAARFAADIAEQAAALAATGSVPERFAAEIAWTVRIAEAFPGDIGVVVALLLNHVTLAPGQAMFLEAGNLHSYLHGVGIELMANSDNVLRGGLTSKHIDVAELLDVVSYAPSAAPIQTPDAPVHRFQSPVPEFSLTRLDGSGDLEPTSFTPEGPSIVLVTEGELVVGAGDQTLVLRSGQAAFVPASDGPLTVGGDDGGTGVGWLATVGADGQLAGRR